MRAHSVRGGNCGTATHKARKLYKRERNKINQISNGALQHKRDHLGKQHHKPPNCNAIEQKARCGAQKSRKTDLSVVCRVKQENKCNARKQAKQQILKKHHRAKHSAFSSPTAWFKQGKLDLLQSFCRAAAVMHAQKHAGDTQQVIHCAKSNTQKQRVQIKHGQRRLRNAHSLYRNSFPKKPLPRFFSSLSAS